MKAKLFAAGLVCISFSVMAASELITNPPVAEEKPLVKIDLNKADLMSLSHSIKGIGEKRAQAIIKYREEHGDFKSIEELAAVKGVGSKFVKAHLPQLEDFFLIANEIK